MNLEPLKFQLYHHYWLPLIKKCEERNLLDESGIIFHKNIFDDLMKKYEEKHRYYHNLKHILYMLDTNRYIQNHDYYPLDDEEAMKFAIFFHDSIYKTDLNYYEYNEVFSCRYCEEMLKNMNFKDNFIRNVASLILSTDLDFYQNGIYKNRNDIDYLHDLDYSYGLLCCDYTTFVYFNDLLKKEFSLFVRLFIFDKERKKFLLELIDNPPIFKTKPFQLKGYETIVKRNILKYLNLEGY